MNRLLAQFIDRAMLGLATLMHAESADRPAHSRAAADWLARGDFFVPDAATPELVFGSGNDFTFPSPIRVGPPCNRVVHGRLFRAGSSLRDRPTVVLIHGWNDEIGYLLRQPMLGRRFAETGVNVAMLELPYHLRRRPAAPPDVRDFISGDVGAMVAAAHQTLADHRALFAWLERQGSGRIAVWGYSLGGWVAGLLACHDPRVDTAVLSTPLSDVAAALRHLPFCRSTCRGLDREPLDLSALNLAKHRPLVPKDRLLLLFGEHDLFMPRAGLDALWEAWDRPERRIVAHGHMSLLASRTVLGETREWLWKRLIRRTPEPAATSPKEPVA